jgi:hypothetical protein
MPIVLIAGNLELLGSDWLRQQSGFGANKMEGVWEDIENKGAGDGVRTRDVQLGNTQKPKPYA